MKRWQKLSLATLVVPTVAGSVSLVAVRCGKNDTGGTTPKPPGEKTAVKTPQLVQSAHITDKAPTLQAWWSSLGNDVAKQVAGLNQIFTETTKLDPKFVSYIIPNFQGVFAFQPTVSLIPTAFFKNSGSNQWFCPKHVSYNSGINAPVLIPNPVIYGTEPDVSTWWKNLGRNTTKQVEALNQVFTKDSQLNADVVYKIDCYPLDSDNHAFNVTINAMPGFRFADNTPYWSTKQPIKYTSKLKIPELKPITNAVNSPVPDPKAWWDNLSANKKAGIDKLNSFLQDTSLKFTENEVKQIDIIVGTNHSFKLKVTLNDGFVFDDEKKTTTWTTPKDINYIIQLKLPTLTAAPTIVNPLPDVQKWWANFGDDTAKKVGAINQLLTTPIKPETVDKIDLIPVTTHSFKITINLNQWYAFEGGVTSWSPNITINYTSELNPPTLISTNPVIVSSELSVQAWWAKFKDTTAQVTAINQIINNQVRLQPDLVDKISFFSNPNDPFRFKFTVALKSNYQFSDGSKEWTPSVDITYAAQVATPQLNANPVINGTELDVRDWIDKLNKQGLDSKVQALNQVLTPGTQLNKAAISDIVFARFNVHQFGVVVTLKKGIYFDDKQKVNTWKNDKPIYFNSQLQTPTFRDADPKIVNTYSDAQTWWNSLGTLEAKVNALNNLLTDGTHLQPSMVKEITPNWLTNAFTLTVKLNPNTFFTDTGKDIWTTPKSIAYTCELPLPSLQDNPKITSSEPNAKTWWDTNIASDSKKALQTLNSFLKPHSPQLDDTDVLKVEIVDYSSSNAFKLKATLKPGFIFKDGNTTWTTPQAIGYTCELPIPILKENLNLSGDKYDAKTWWDTNIHTKTDALNQINTHCLAPGTPALTETEVSSVDFMNESDHEFQLKVNLNPGFAFKGGDTFYITQSIHYTCVIAKPAIVNPSPAVEIIDDPLNEQDWWNSIKNDTQKCLQLFNSKCIKPGEPQLPDVAVKAINIEFTLSNTFKLTVQLKDYFAFPDGSTSITSNPCVYCHALKPPKAKTGEFKFSGDQIDAKAWWAWNYEENKKKALEIFNSFFESDLLTEEEVEKVDLVGPSDNNKFSLSAILNTGFRFKNDRGVTTNICYTPYFIYQWLFPTPTFKTGFDNLKIVSSDNGASAWWEKNKTDGLNIFNSFLQTGDGHFRKPDIQGITFISSSANTFKLKLTLYKNYTFADGNSVTTPDINYVQIIPRPVLINSPFITATESTPVDWWQSLGTNEAKLNKINPLFTPETRLPNPNVGQFLQFATTQSSFKISIDLNKYYIFSGGGSSWESDGVIGYSCVPLVKSSSAITHNSPIDNSSMQHNSTWRRIFHKVFRKK